MLTTRLHAYLGIELPIILAPMGPALSTPELAAAVSNAGGLGLVSFGGFPPPELRRLIGRIRDLTDRPFGVNVILDPGLVLPIDRTEVIRTCLDERVPVLSLSFGDPAPYVAMAQAAGVTVMHQVGSVAAARQATAAGVDIIIAQGSEAGGHLAGDTTTLALVPRVVDAVAPTPVVAAGGIADARGLVAALALGAEGVMIGTRFLATDESAAHPVYKQKLVEMAEDDTVRTLLFGGGWPGVPHRALRTAFVAEWLGQEARGQAGCPNEPVVGSGRLAGHTIPIVRFGSLPPDTETRGDLDAMCFLAGEGVGLIEKIKPAAAVIDELVSGARDIIARQHGGVAAPAPIA